MTETRKCPMCAETIPADAVFCPYCGTHFGEEVQAPPQPAAPATVIFPQAAPANVQPAIPASPSARKNHLGFWIAGSSSLVVILVLLGTLLWTQRANIPALSGLFTTLTPTFTPTLPPTLTPIPTATPTPDNIVVPIEEMVSSIPWLPSDPNAVPSITILVFDTNQPPFDNLLVRQALAAAIDRQAIARIAEEYGRKNVRPATSFTPAITLGLDLYEQVGIPFDPNRARILLDQAGYANGTNFPPITIYTNPAGFRVPIVTAIADMWKTNLNFTIKVEVAEDFATWQEMLSTHLPLYRVTWYNADTNDPDIFLRNIFRTGLEQNASGFSNSTFDELVDRAAQSTDPALRQELYIQAERILCEEEVQIIPLFSDTGE